MVSNQSMSSPPPEAAVLSPDQREAALREIIVFIDGHTKAGGILEFAGEQAEEHAVIDTHWHEKTPRRAWQSTRQCACRFALSGIACGCFAAADIQHQPGTAGQR